MTTHQLASLLDHLRNGFGPGLKSDAIKELSEASEAFRELTDQPLKTFLKEIRVKPAKGGVKKEVDLPALIERIRAVQGGTELSEAVGADLERLTSTQLKDVLKAFGQKGTSTKDGNLARVKSLLRTDAAGFEAVPDGPSFDPTLVESGIQLYHRLRDGRDISIEEVRAQFGPIRLYPKPVVEEISRRLGYTPDGTREAIAQRLLSNLESIKIHQLRGDLIHSGS